MRGSKRNHALLRNCVCIGAIIQAGAAMAQTMAAKPEVEAADVQGLQDIIVTAQRIETNLQTTPVSVTAISSETLKQRGSTDLLDLANYTPSLSIAGNSAGGGTGNGASVAIRGMGVGAPDSSAAVGVYVDNVYQPSIFGNMLGLLDIERVEVLRGPQGTLFGRNTLAGAIQYVSRKPGHEFEGNFEGTVGTIGRYAARGAINVPMGDTLALRLAGSYDNQGGYVTDDLNRVKRGRVRSLLGRAQVRWTPTEDLTVDVKVDYARRKENGRPVAIIGANPNALFGGLALLSGENRPISNAYLSTRKYHFAGYNAPDYFNSTLHTYAGTIAYDISDTVRLKSITAYVDNASRGATDFDMTPLDLFRAFRGNYLDRVFSQELQLAGASFADRFHWTVGAYYYAGNSSLLGQTYSVGRPGPMNPQQSNDDVRNEVRSIAGYGQGTFDLIDQLSLTGGLRYTHDKLTGIDQTLNGLSNKATFTDWSPRVGINVKATEDIFLYASAAKGFRAGGFSINRALLDSIDPQYRTIALAFKPETAWTYEIGARLEFFDKRLRINPTLFYTDWKNIQFQRDVVTGPPSNTIIGATLNAGDAHIKGAELEIQAAPVDGLLLTATGSYLDSQYTRIENFTLNTYPFGFLAFLGGTPGSLVVQPNLSLHSPLQQSPKFKYTLGARYAHNLASGSTVVANLDWAHTSGFRIGVTDGSSQRISAYGVLNGRLQFATVDQKFSIAAYATNLLDKYYLNGGTGTGKGYTIGFDEGDVARPREMGLTIGTRF